MISKINLTLCLWVPEDVSLDIEIFPNNEFFDGTLFKSQNCVSDSKTVFPSVSTDLVKIRSLIFPVKFEKIYFMSKLFSNVL